MSLLDRFRREKDEDIEEDSSIYKDEATPNRLASFMFGFFALVLTLLIAGGLFFGVRGIYRAVHGNNSQTQTTASDQSKNKENSSNSASEQKKKTSSASGGQSNGAAHPSSTPSTGDNLPNTGDNLTLPKTGDPGM